MKSIEVSELHRLLSRFERVDLVDVRTPQEFAVMHIAGARNIPLHELSAADLQEPDAPVYLLCHSGVRAHLAADQLERQGFQNVFVVKCGMLAWEEAGLPVEGEVEKQESVACLRIDW
jgi:Rhodanese-related sulfurtransferase